ncbi:SCP2 domain-containing protein [Pseudomonas sp. gcc21]|uniref:ubiquinone biosynthesis accessory factor UbiJ n=1 Tax=Pseudomonas sp. gcc21 TaxID=2726989 RepID=UPI0014518FDA|nr:SCP2 sterol-binding domain-containing protein [Pseudomonas sp. gcc21]QJD60081.1 SCP2 domain-containing protein [Pseudomonas sp. gcc21]
MLTQAMLAGIEYSLEQAIARDPLTARRLAALAGKVILIRGTSPDWQVFVLPAKGEVRLMSQSELDPDCTLTAPSNLLAQLVVSNQRQRLLQDPQVVLSGDSQVLVTLQNIFGDLRIDGEAELARWLGPVAAHAIATVLRSGRNWGAQTHESLSHSLGRYLTEETRQLVGKAEANVAAEELHALQLRLDRLEARLQRLEKPPQDTPDA